MYLKARWNKDYLFQSYLNITPFFRSIDTSYFAGEKEFLRTAFLTILHTTKLHITILHITNQSFQKGNRESAYTALLVVQ